MKMLHENCGVVAAASFKGENVFPYLYWSLLTLNHRGQQSYGFSTYSKEIHTLRRLGLVANLTPKNILFLSKKLSGSIGIAHTRYATSGGLSRKSLLSDAQPYLMKRDGNIILTIAYNGNVVNAIPLKEKLKSNGFNFSTSSDIEILAYEILQGINDEGSLVEGIKKVMEHVDGAYSVVGITDDGMLFSFKDPHGIRPLVYGFDKDRELLLIASESVALDVNNVPYQASIKPGELILVEKTGIRHFKLIENYSEAMCAFEYVYFSRSDSRLDDGRYLYEVRRKLGRMLAKRNPEIIPHINIIVPVPQTAIDAAYGFHEETGKPIEPVIIRHRYIMHRAFIMPVDERINILSKKYNVLTDKVKDKNIALIDDSIVRGDTLKHIVSMLRKAGAEEIHIFSTYPKIRYPCFYGIDMATFHELVGFNRNDDEIAKILGADSVNYQRIDDFYSIIGSKNLCTACITGRYPTSYAQNLADISSVSSSSVKGRLTEIFGG